MLPAKNLSSPPHLLPAEQIPTPSLLLKSAMACSPSSGSREPAHVAGKPISAPSGSKWRAFSFLIDLLFLVPNFITVLLTTFPKLVPYPLRIYNQNLKFGIFVLWAMFLEKAPVIELWTILFPMFGNVRPPLPSMTLGGWSINLKQRRRSLRFFVEDPILCMEGPLFYDLWQKNLTSPMKKCRGCRFG